MLMLRVRPLVGIPHSLLVFMLYFEISLIWVCEYVLMLPFSMKVTKVKLAYTSTYFVKLNANASVHVNNKLMLTFSLRFLFNFYLLGLFHSLMHARCRTNKKKHSEVVCACILKGQRRQQQKQRLAWILKQLLKIQILHHVCNMHSCMHGIPAIRTHSNTECGVSISYAWVCITSAKSY